MKKVLLWPMMLMGLTLSFSSCGDDDPINNEEEKTEYSFENLPANTGTVTETQLSATVTQFVDAVVLPTYKDMYEKMQAYHAAVEKFLASGSQNDLADACEAWRAVRIPWEQSEAFLFGVADLGQYDPSLDSWPLDKDGIEQIIANGDFSAVTGDVDDSDDAPANAPQNLRGFHTAEKMLFLDGKERDAATFTDKNEKEYLRIVSDRMLKDTEELYKGWLEGLGSGSVPSSYAEAMKKHDGSSDYAGLSSAYQAIELMLNGDNGMGGISNEVGTAKIKDPVDAWNDSNKDASDPDNPGVLAVESWYSWNSLDDYKNNIVSIKNAYFGGRDLTADDASENSLHNLCKTVNPVLDSLMVLQIDNTIDAIDNIPYPFRSNLGAETEINAAMEACSDLTKGLDKVRAALSDN
ncbi:imelysin family protein [uncultured Parabacteroides sp.]|uniref:imelysin family protein n=1 Tax=uncultured Parabacteroides sp. TaxID=512312 RepID=UPI0026088662|nr:imelysin family protein [uncultured Parabacteroides sp.]